jgi:hypothetical protein
MKRLRPDRGAGLPNRSAGPVFAQATAGNLRQSTGREGWREARRSRAPERCEGWWAPASTEKDE